MKRMNTIRLNTQLIKTLSDVILMPSTRIMKYTGIPNSTWYYITDHPEGISIQQLLQLSNRLHIPVRRFFSDGMADLIGRREDYIIEPYKECRYDDASLQNLVNASPSATWQRAAKAIGMSRSRLRDSLLAVTRTPVVRFLKVCEAFDIDPFTILIDPNQSPRVRRRPQTAGAQAAGDKALKDDVMSLTKRIEDLNAAVSNITEKYEDLLKRHTALLDRHNELERRFNDFVGYDRPHGGR